MDLMRLLPDKEFDLAIVDPPYGGKRGADGSEANTVCRTGGTWSRKYQRQEYGAITHGGAIPGISKAMGRPL